MHRNVFERHFGQAIDRLVLDLFLIGGELLFLLDDFLYLCFRELLLKSRKRCFFFVALFLLQRGIGFHRKIERMGIVEKIAAHDLGKIGWVGQMIFEILK